MKIAAVPNGLTVVIDSTTGSGTIRQEYTVEFDGRDYPYVENLDTVTPHAISADAEYVVSANRIDPHTFELKFKQPGNTVKVPKAQRYVVSANGSTQTVTITDTNAGGPFEDTLVFEKQK
jgi:hypothetical protein